MKSPNQFAIVLIVAATISEVKSNNSNITKLPCPVKDIFIYTEDIDIIDYIRTWQECAQICYEYNGCNYWSWYVGFMSETPYCCLKWVLGKYTDPTDHRPNTQTFYFLTIF